MKSRAQCTPHPAVEWLLWLVWTCARPPVAAWGWAYRRMHEQPQVHSGVLGHWRWAAALGLVLLLIQAINLGFVLR